jgi:hypothetical protein
MSTFKPLRGNYLLDRNVYLAAGEPAIFHCHHYNCFLQAALEDTRSYIDIDPILMDSAQEIAYSQLSRYFSDEEIDSIGSRKRIAEEYFSFCGFGKFSLEHITEVGGTIESIKDHYGVGWLSKFGNRKPHEPGASFFTCGYLAGATEAIFDLPLGTLQTLQVACVTKGDKHSQFRVSHRGSRRSLYPSPAEGEYQKHVENNHPNSSVNYLGIREALINMPLQGSADTGLLEAFGVLLTRHYANYYGLISFRMLKEMEKKLGADGIALASQLLTEAGHVCAFNTFGGIMTSAEWEGLIKPMLKDRKDWVHGIVAVVNAFGWGFWEVDDLTDTTLRIRIVSGYESNCYLKKYGTNSYPISFLARGGTAGIMNLLFNGDITSKPALTENYYKEIFTSEKSFRANQMKCRTMSDPVDVFEASFPKL